MQEEALLRNPQLSTHEEEASIPIQTDQPMPDSNSAQPQHGSESESESDSSDDDDEQKNLHLQTLEAELATNSSQYDAHVEYIKLLRDMGEIEKLRRAREAMSELFPLTPALWQEWARDEASLGLGTSDFSAIEKLYERGVFDYLSLSLWSDYLEFVQEHDSSVRECSAAGISKMRDLYERALTATGLHVAEGSKIWEAYKEFEQIIFHAIDETDIQAKEKQIQRIRSIFQRHMSVPLVDMKSTLLGYKAWEVEQGGSVDVESDSLDGVPSHVASAYQKALELYDDRICFEEQISKQDVSDSERLKQFMDYLKFEKSFGDPARVQVLYERAITGFPISSDLWLDYTRFLDNTLKVGSIVNCVYTRAVKNCPWVGELWVRYLICLERGHASEKEIAGRTIEMEVFEKSLQCSYSTLDEYLDLYLTRVDGLRRRMTTSEAEGLDYLLIRETFQQASYYLSSQLKNTDSLLRLHAYWARLEISLGKDLVAARGVWESLLKICGSMLEVWQGYIAMEVELGHISEARSLYRRCYSKRFPGTGSEDICHSWLRFEREFGTLENLDHAVQKATPRLEELQLFRLQQDSKSIEEKDLSIKKNPRDKRKAGSDITGEQSPAKRQKDSAQNVKKVHIKDRSQFQNSVEQNSMEEAKAQVVIPDVGKEQLKKDSFPEKTKVYTDQCTVFVSNLHLKATRDDLREFFSDVGGLIEIRVLHDKNTHKSRGLAYADFADEKHLAAAIAKNRQKLLGKRISIRRSDPKGSSRGPSGKSFSMEQDQEHSNKPALSATRETGSVETKYKESPSNLHKPPLPPGRKPRVDGIELKGKNTFAIPRNVVRDRTANKQNEGEKQVDDEEPKSNDEFRKMFFKS